MSLPAEEQMNIGKMNPAYPTGIFCNAVVLSGVLMAFGPGLVLAEPVPKQGTAPYTTHFVFHPKSTVDIPGVGKVIALEAAGQPKTRAAGGCTTR
jgi:hypothetical protein